MKKLLFLAIIICFGYAVQASEKDTILFPLLSKTVMQNPKALAEAITKDAVNDENRALIVFYWITHHIQYDIHALTKSSKIKRYTAVEILKRQIADSRGYSDLLKAMCEAIGIRTQVIEGYEKNETYDDGTRFYKPNHVWNAVLVNYKWNIIDATNGAGVFDMKLGWLKQQLQKVNKKKLYYSTKQKFVFEYHPEFFFPDPKTFRVERLPTDPLWQLLDPPMPLNVFELGEADIKEFNENVISSRQLNPHLSEINLLSEQAALLECADRTYQFNPRYTVMKAAKHLALANDNFDKVLQQESTIEALSKKEAGKAELKAAKEILADQKLDITAEYTELRKLNNEKKVDVVKYKQNFTTINSKFIAMSTSHLSTAKTKINAWKSDLAMKAKKSKEIDIANFKKVKTNKSEKDEKDPALKLILDSVNSRSSLVAELKSKMNSQKEIIATNRKSLKDGVDTLEYYLIKTDSAFLKEGIARLKKQDSYDDSIKTLRSELNRYKTVKVDKLQQAYFDTYDSTVVKYEFLKKQYSSVLDALKKNIQDLEKYRKMNASNLSVEDAYTQNVNDYQEANEAYVNNSAECIDFIKVNMTLTELMKKKYTNENKYFVFLVNTEDDRKNYYKDVLAKYEEMEKKVNESNKTNVKNLSTKMDIAFKKKAKENWK